MSQECDDHLRMQCLRHLLGLKFAVQDIKTEDNRLKEKTFMVSANENVEILVRSGSYRLERIFI